MKTFRFFLGTATHGETKREVGDGSIGFLVTRLVVPNGLASNDVYDGSRKVTLGELKDYIPEAAAEWSAASQVAKLVYESKCSPTEHAANLALRILETMERVYGTYKPTGPDDAFAGRIRAFRAALREHGGSRTDLNVSNDAALGKKNAAVEQSDRPTFFPSFDDGDDNNA